MVGDYYSGGKCVSEKFDDTLLWKMVNYNIMLQKIMVILFISTFVKRWAVIPVFLHLSICTLVKLFSDNLGSPFCDFLQMTVLIDSTGF